MDSPPFAGHRPPPASDGGRDRLPDRGSRAWRARWRSRVAGDFAASTVSGTTAGTSRAARAARSSRRRKLCTACESGWSGIVRILRTSSSGRRSAFRSSSSPTRARSGTPGRSSTESGSTSARSPTASRPSCNRRVGAPPNCACPGSTRPRVSPRPSTATRSSRLCAPTPSSSRARKLARSASTRRSSTTRRSSSRRRDAATPPARASSSSRTIHPHMTAVAGSSVKGLPQDGSRYREGALPDAAAERLLENGDALSRAERANPVVASAVCAPGDEIGHLTHGYAVSRVPGSGTPPSLSFGRPLPRRSNVTRPRESTSTTPAVREPRSRVACQLRSQA